MGTKSSMRRALHHAMPNATADEAFDFGWKHGQGRYASKRMQEIERQLREMQSQRDTLERQLTEARALCDSLARLVFWGQALMRGMSGWPETHREFTDWENDWRVVKDRYRALTSREDSHK